MTAARSIPASGAVTRGTPVTDTINGNGVDSYVGRYVTLPATPVLCLTTVLLESSSSNITGYAATPATNTIYPVSDGLPVGLGTATVSVSFWETRDETAAGDLNITVTATCATTTDTVDVTISTVVIPVRAIA